MSVASTSSTAPMKNEHRMFLQGIMCRKLINATEVKELLRSCNRANGSCNNEVDITGFISTINKNIEPFHMLISKCVGEQDGKQFYALINTQDSPLTRLSTDYTSNELDLFQQLLENVVESEEGYVSSTVVLNLTDQLQKKMSKMEAQDLLDRFEEERWIIQANGKVSLSALSILEFDQYIRETYADIVVICQLCKRIALQGDKCEKCDLKIHSHCSKRFFQNMSEKKCPKCHSRWSSDGDRRTSLRASKRSSQN